jgi:hypothetical protein
MNQKNFEYLKDGLKYLGFGEGLNNKLAEELASDKTEFQMRTENGYGWDKVNYALDFKKSDSSDMFFFNRYTASFKPDGDSPERSQTFYIKKNAGITAKEAYNLLNGRFVNKDLITKEGKPYNAWLQIDFNEKDETGNHKIKMIHQAYGFNLENELSKHPIKELNEPATKDRLMQSLERGNLHQVTFVRGEREDKMFIEANPQFKTLNLYDARLKKVYQDLGRREQQLPSNEKDVSEPEKKQEKKKEAKEDQEEQAEGTGKKAAPRKRLGV